MYEALISDFARAENIDENLKASNQMKWIQMMQNIDDRAKEMIETEILYK